MQRIGSSRKIVGGLLVALLAGGLVEAGLAQQPRRPDPKHAMALSDLFTLSAAIKQFRLDCDRYPTTKEGLRALRQCQPGLEGKWRGPYLSRTVPNDPWGHPYSYAWPGRKGPKGFEVISQGPGKGMAIVVSGPIK